MDLFRQGKIKIYSPLYTYINLFAILALLGIIPFYMMSIDPSAPFSYEETREWSQNGFCQYMVAQLLALYLSFSCILTLRGALRGH